MSEGVQCTIWEENTKLSRTKAKRVLSRGNVGHRKHPFPKTQETILHMENII